jgi:AcrR family transcriptional regulator
LSRIIESPEQLILNKAKEVLYKEGYHKLTMRNISKACDIALGTIYNYYPTKKELVVAMMTDYWSNYFYKIEGAINSDILFYDNLHVIFNELSTFIKTFKEIWLKPELYDNPDYIEGGMKKENIYIERLIILIENLLKKELNNNNAKSKMDTYEAAKFIVMNFITMIQMPIFKYTSFEIILKELIK